MNSAINIKHSPYENKMLVKSICFLLTTFLFFCFGLHFIGKTTLWLLLIDGLIIALLALFDKRKQLSLPALVLVLFSFFYFLFLEDKDFKSFIRLVISIPLLFLGGKFFGENFSWKKNKILLYVLFLSFFFYQFLTLLKNYNSIDETRFTLDFWENESTQPTNFNSLGVFIIVCFPSMLFLREKVITKFIFFIASLLVVLAAIKTATRTNIYLFAIMILLDFLFFLWNRKKHKVSKDYFVKRIQSLLTILFCALIFAFLFKERIAGAFENSLMASRIQQQGSYLQLSNDGRWANWNRVFLQLFDYPFGNPTSYPAHNLFLDVGRVSGFLPLFFLLSFFVAYYITIKAKNPQTNIPFEQKIFYFSILSGLFLSFMIEPVLEGRPYNFLTFIYVCGSYLGIHRKNSKQRCY